MSLNYITVNSKMSFQKLRNVFYKILILSFILQKKYFFYLKNRFERTLIYKFSSNNYKYLLPAKPGNKASVMPATSIGQ